MVCSTDSDQSPMFQVTEQCLYQTFLIDLVPVAGMACVSLGLQALICTGTAACSVVTLKAPHCCVVPREGA